jgi:plastocyanin
MKRFDSIRLPVYISVLMLAVPLAAKAQTTYNASVGAEAKDESVQANAFCPNELWVFQNDSVKWTFVPKNEIHTVTFLTPGQVRPPAPPPVGPPGPPFGPPFAFAANCTAPASPASYNSSTCVSSLPSSSSPNPTSFTVKFPTPGNYKLVCLVHTYMNGTVHVLSTDPTSPFYVKSLPYAQPDYDRQAGDEASDILKDGDDQREEVKDSPGNNVIAGIGEIVATGGGVQYRSVVRFLDGTIHIHAGDSVTWVNLDPTEPHTVTFGTEPGAFVPTIPAGLGKPAADGTLTAAYNPAIFLNSGFLQAQAADRTAPASGDIQLPPGATRITITFPKPGNYSYHCALHDVDGMVGKVVVSP